MFTGIVQGTAEVVRIEAREGLHRHRLRFPAGALVGIVPGASVAHNGCCLTVVSVAGDEAEFDLMRETLRITNLGTLREGERVNFERAARFGDEIGGHAMSGHVCCTAAVVEVIRSENNRQLWFELPPEWARYLFAKGYIGVDGTSLTIGEVRGRRFCVNLIPETLQRTNLGGRREGERVNIEIDPQTQAIVDTVERVLAERAAAEG